MKHACVLSMIVMLILTGLFLAINPACALKVYVNPSIQNGNVSPDGTYIEGYSMQDVAVRLVAKLQARGYEARSSYWMSVTNGINDATSWGAECFVALHTNAWPQMGGTAHGSQGFYYRRNKRYSQADYDLAYKCSQKCKAKFSQWGVGYDGGAYGNDWMEVCLYAPGDHMLMEALYHDNTNDLAVLRRDYGREAYAQAMFEAICDHYGWTYGSTLYPMPTGPVAIAPDGRMEVFATGANGEIYHCWQTVIDGGFSAWTSRGGSMVGNPATGRNADGRVEVFARGADGQVWRKYQTAYNGSWTADWESLGGNAASDLTVGMNLNGCLEIFARGPDNALWHCWQSTPGGAWTAWSSLGGDLRGNPSVGRNADGRLDVFARDASGIVCHIYHNTPGGTWSSWASTGITVAGDPVVNTDADGRVEFVARGVAGDLIDVWESSVNSTTFGTASFGGNITGEPVLGRNGDGRLEVVACDAASPALLDKNQVSQNSSWTAWASIGGSWGGNPVICRNANGKLQVFCRGTDGAMYTSAQTTNGGTWSAWSAMGGSLF